MSLPFVEPWRLPASSSSMRTAAVPVCAFGTPSKENLRNRLGACARGLLCANGKGPSYETKPFRKLLAKVKLGDCRAARQPQCSKARPFSTLARTALSVEVAAIARRIAGKAPGEIALEQARAAAEAEIELGRVRDVRRALIDLAATSGSLETPRYFSN